jgi:spore cortex biosynthesis protein YabQ
MIANQVYVFLYAILSGAIVALLYDILRIKRRAIKTNVIIVGLEDILYWIVAAILLFLTVYKSNSGEMRGYIFLGNAIGVILYEELLSKFIISSSVMIINIIKKVVSLIFRILFYPFKVIFKILAIPLSFIFKQLLRFVKFNLKKLKFVGGKAGNCTKKGLKKVAGLHKRKNKSTKQDF